MDFSMNRPLSPFELAPDEIDLLLRTEMGITSTTWQLENEKRFRVAPSHVMYYDFSHVDDANLGPDETIYGRNAFSLMCGMSPTNCIIVEKATIAPRKGVELFPSKLMKILSMDNPVIQRSITWLPHGRAFQVLDEKMFEEKIMNISFNTTKIRSFKRQLNLWGFKRIAEGIDQGAYYHQMFLKDKPNLAKRIELDANAGVQIAQKHGVSDI